MKASRIGVSMIEILIGVMLLVLMLIPSLNVMIGQTKTVTSTRDHSQAAFLAQKIIEIARSCSFNMLDSEKYLDDSEKQQKTFEYKLLNDPEYNTHVINDITYKIDAEFTSIDPIKSIEDSEDSIPNLYAFKYRITYIGKDNREHSLDMYTLLSQR